VILHRKIFHLRHLLTLVLVASVAFGLYRVWLVAREYTWPYGPYTSLFASGDVVVFVGADGAEGPNIPVGTRFRVLSDSIDSDYASPDRPVSLELLRDPNPKGEVVELKRKQLRLAWPAW
jgi:hypothetical protein